jgi:four helix bundle protein
MKRQEITYKIRGFCMQIYSLESVCIEQYHLSILYKQLVRAASSVALNYAESNAAESRADFVHKIAVALKELDEIAEILVHISNSIEPVESGSLSWLIAERNELGAIFGSSLRTSSSKLPKRRR